jgi:hypothetical protein
MIPSSLPASLEALLPSLQLCDSLTLFRGDVVIHAPGFEERTMAIVDSVMSRAGARALLLDHLPFNPKNRSLDVRAALSATGIELRDEDILKYNRFNPGDFEARLQRRLLSYGARRVVVDISSMSKLAIMLVLHVCRTLDLEVRILYAEAQRYAPSKEEFDSAREKKEIHRPTLQVFTGIYGVVRVDSLASVAMQGQPTAALVFMSFNDALTQVLLNTAYPGRLFLINGRPPEHQWREAATAWIHDQVRREWEEDNPVEPGVSKDMPLPKRVASTLDYRETVPLLLQLYWDLSAKHRILLAPAGSKMQAVACYLVKALHPDIHVEYPSPEGFSQEYSSGIGARWLLDLACFSERLSAIADVERRVYLEIPT